MPRETRPEERKGESTVAVHPFPPPTKTEFKYVTEEDCHDRLWMQALIGLGGIIQIHENYADAGIICRGRPLMTVRQQAERLMALAERLEQDAEAKDDSASEAGGGQLQSAESALTGSTDLSDEPVPEDV